MDERQRETFQQTVWQFYEQNGRHDLPWRSLEDGGSFDPYKILVSEIMLQQTQVPRVIPKYRAFLDAFPTVEALAMAPLSAVLGVWNGLGYNRRAKYLWRAAQAIMGEYQGDFPRELAQLDRLPGVGANTAGAVLAYAFNLPVVFIETNIRTVFIHHFFADQTGVSDKEIAAVVGDTLDVQHPREWYWALMDYGSFLKQSVGNKSRSSKAYAKQPKFAGSNRQLRGAIIKTLLEKPQTKDELQKLLIDERLPAVLVQLTHEGLIKNDGGHFSIT